MQEEASLIFGAFRLDVVNACLWRGEQKLVLTPKAFAVLRYLVEHPGQLVTKKEFFQTIWPDTYVSDAALSVCIREIRKALNDNPKAPRFIETVHRRGFRFIAPLTTSPPPVSSAHFQVPSRQTKDGHQQQRTGNPSPETRLVGRNTELVQLHQWLGKTLNGERQIVFVTGEPGVGKSSLVEAFIAGIRNQEMGVRCLFPQQPPPSPQISTLDLWIGLGQCIEHFGASEPYLPVLAALGQICREPEGQRLRSILSQHAPTWLLQMPGFLGAEEYEALQRKTLGVTRDRMLREIAEALELMTAEHPLVLILEDLHWSDASTLDLIAFLARRRQPARLLVIGTYRPVEVILRAHPLRAVKQELQLHGRCVEIPLLFLTKVEVGEYLEHRCPGGARLLSFFHQLAGVIHLRTEGNPLFMVNVVEYFVTRGFLVCGDEGWEFNGDTEAIAAGVPESLRQMVETHFTRLSTEDRQVLEVASVAGRTFSAAAVAAGLGTEVGEIEGWCAGLSRSSHFLQVEGIAEWPDGTVATCYSFPHAFYQEVIYERVPLGRRIQLHQRIGEREEAGRGERAGEAAAELAVHFERGRDYRRAVQYHELAAQNAMRCHAYREARSLLTKGLELLKALPDTPERTYQELQLQITLGALLQAASGYAAPEVETTYARARVLCQQLGETARLFPVLRGLWVFYLLRVELQSARELGGQLFTLAQAVHDPVLLVEAHYALGTTLFFRGELVPAREHLEHCITLYDRQQHYTHASLYGQDPGVFGRSVDALTLWLLGYAERALERAREAVLLAQELSHPNSLAAAMFFAAWLHGLRREAPETQEQATAVLTVSREQGFPFWLAWGTIMEGGALIGQGQEEAGISQTYQGLALLQNTGAALARPYVLAHLIGVYGGLGRIEEGNTLLTEMLTMIEQTGERFYEAELHRLKGELTLQQEKQKAKGKGQKAKMTSTQILASNTREAEACFLKAIDIARHQQAKSLELRAVMSLSRLWQQQGKKAEVQPLLSEIYNWFTEGFDTKDLQEAKALKEELA